MSDKIEQRRIEKIWDECSLEEKNLVFLDNKKKNFDYFQNKNSEESLLYRFILNKNGQDIGFVDINEDYYEKNVKAGYVIIVIRSKFRGKGYGKVLLYNAINKAKELKLEKLYYGTSLKNKTSLNFIQNNPDFRLNKIYTDIDFISYYTDLTRSKKLYKRARKIWEACNEKERLFISPRSGNYIDSDRILYREVLVDRNNNDIGFIDIYPYNSSIANGFIVLAVHPNYRGKGYGKALLDKAVEYGKRSGMKKLYYRCDIANKSSIIMVEKYGKFKRSNTNAKSYCSFVLDLEKEE